MSCITIIHFQHACHVCYWRSLIRRPIYTMQCHL
jgi:hypothetical protein